MTQPIEVLEAPLEQNLLPLSVYWWQQEIPHQITERAGVQVVFSLASQHCQQIRDDYQQFVSGELQLTVSRRPRPAGMSKRAVEFFAQYRVTLTLVVLSIFGFLLVEFDHSRHWVDWLTIQSVDKSQLTGTVYAISRVSPQQMLAQGEYWRMITPIFLHFGWLHITFNMLWLWELGRRIEKQGGAIHFASIVFFIGIASNFYQAASTPFAYFGGMSGVIFGLVGYCAVFNLIAPHKLLKLPRELYVIMFITLAVGWLGVLDFIARMANTAHTSGFLWGCFIALPSAFLARFYWKDDDFNVPKK